MNKTQLRDLRSKSVIHYEKRKMRSSSFWEKIKLLQLQYQIMMHKQSVAIQQMNKSLEKFPKKESNKVFIWNLQKSKSNE